MKLLLSILLSFFIHQAAYTYSTQKISTLHKHHYFSLSIGFLIGWLWMNQSLKTSDVFLLFINLYVFFTDYYFRLIPLRVHFLYLLFMKVDFFHILFLLLFLLILLYFARNNKIGCGDLLLMGSSGLMIDTLTFNWVLLTASLLGILFHFTNKNTQDLPFGSFWVLALSLLMNYQC